MRNKHKQPIDDWILTGIRYLSAVLVGMIIMLLIISKIDKPPEPPMISTVQGSFEITLNEQTGMINILCPSMRKEATT